jgi:hypothetical protein
MLMMVAVSTAEMSVSFYKTAGHNIQEDSPLQMIIYFLSSDWLP